MATLLEHERITAKIAEIRRSIKRKHADLTRGKFESDLRLREDFKPLTEPLIKLAEQIADSEEIKTKQSKKEIYPKVRPPPRESAEELKNKEEQDYREFEKKLDMSAMFDQLTEEDRIKYGKRAYECDGSACTRSFGEVRQGEKRPFSELHRKMDTTGLFPLELLLPPDTADDEMKYVRY